jgi:mannose/fructose-specific phosphotransferase system component IIA
MSDGELRGVVVCHGRLAAALVEAVEHITGIGDALVPVSNSGCDRAELETRVLEALDDRPAVVFVDLATGSCLFAVLNRLRSRPDVKVVTGVNLAMLVDFVFHRGVGPAEAANRAVATGEKAIRVP